MDFKTLGMGTLISLAIATALGAILPVLGSDAAKWLKKQVLRPVAFVAEAVYSWFAPRNPFSISLRSYRKRVSRSELARIENPVGPSLEVPLEHAFAPLKLISGDGDDSVDLFSKAASSHRCMVLGGPGTGKTTLMKSLVTAVIRGRVREEALKDLIPVFVYLRKLAKNGHTVEQAVVSAFDDHHFPGAGRFVASALDQGKMLVILDGLDEVGASRAFVAEQIQDFCRYDEQREHRNRLFVTCREHSYRTRDLRAVIPEVVRVEPFANHHMRVFLQGWPAHKGRAAVKLYGLIQGDPQIRDICRNPLLLTILTGLYLDTDNFELPASRERFYKDAVDELLIHRPHRRHLAQAFEAEDKRQILQRVALDRLETAERHEDPEEFTREVIRRKAEEVLRRDGFDPRELIKELVEVNGIIKPADEGSFTCAHRTIQEYFAAWEARRMRRTEEVVEHFGGRPEFVEVLYFYCGLVDNLPSLAYVVNTLGAGRRWLEAGRCILYMKEPPGRAPVESVAAGLYEQVSPSAEYKAALEVLSSMAQRRAPEFEPARELFARAVDRLVEGYGEGGASLLESALATSPEAAMRVVPGLLKHRSRRWKEAAVQLLRDIGTDDALDQLVMLLADADPVVRHAAGRKLAGMLKTRRAALEARAALLPPREDPNVWPLEDLFPGRLAIPIAESLAEDGSVRENQAIDYAVRAIRARSGGPDPYVYELVVWLWPRVMRDRALQRYRLLAGRAVITAAYLLPTTCALLLLVLQAWGLITDKVVTVTLPPVRVWTAPGQLIRDVRSQAELIAADIEQRYPPNASGWSRVLPWNWSVEPDLPEHDEETLEALRRWAKEDLDPYAIEDAPLRLLFMRTLVPDDKVDAMEARLDSLKRLPDVRGRWYMTVNPSLRSGAGMLVGGLVSFAVSFWSVKRVKKYGGIRVSLPSLRMASSSMLVAATMQLVTTWSGSLLLRWLPFLAFLLIGSAGFFLEIFNWPDNPLLDAFEAIGPRDERKSTRPTQEDDDDVDDNGGDVDDVDDDDADDGDDGGDGGGDDD